MTEREAKRFAGALLLPPADFDTAMTTLPQLRDSIALKSSWGVSIAALVYRAYELNYIDDRRRRALRIQISKWRQDEPGVFDPVHGQLLCWLFEVKGGLDAVEEPCREPATSTSSSTRAARAPCEVQNEALRPVS
jgi:hypothetical protein